MNALSQKLLSWLCVVAMVLSLVPAVALPAAAEEIEAAPEQKEEIVYGSAKLPEGTQDIIDAAKEIQDADLAAHIEAGTCPVCGEGVEWKPAVYPNKCEVEGASLHYYLDDSITPSKKYNWYAANAKDVTMCLALLNTTPKEIGGLIGMRNNAVNCTLNIMGSGTITSDDTASSDGQFGVICVQGSKNTVNLYGGTFIYTGDGQGRNEVVTDNGDGTTTTTYTPNGKITAGAITIKGLAADSANVVNMFDGVNIGPEEQDTTKATFNVVMVPQKARQVMTFNMYGGTIRNGVSNLNKTSGNVHTSYDGTIKNTKPTFNMYGGTITGGTFTEETDSANGGNMYCSQGSQVTLYGGTITGGKAFDHGGNLFAVDSSVTKIALLGGTVENGEAKNGGNIYATASVTVAGTALVQNGVANGGNGGNIALRGETRSSVISGGKITGGKAEAGNGGNIWTTGKVTVSDGIIENGEARYGGNLTVQNVFTMTGGTVQNGIATDASGGGNLYATSNSECPDGVVLNITGGTITGGKATSASGGGGNLRINCQAVNIGGTAQIMDGESGFMGGNIYITTGCVVTVNGDAVISGGRSNHDGGSIALYDGKLTIGGNAQVSGGKATRYDTSYNEETQKEKENFLADGGNIYCYAASKTIDGVKVYTNELTIQDNAVISDGWSVRGGNVAAEHTKVTIGSGVTIRDGCAGLEVDGEMTYSASSDNVGRGGNVFIGSNECEINIAATLSGGQGRFGGNLGQYGGTVNFTGIMEKGLVSGFGGNACVQGSKTVLNLNGAQLRDATSNGQGGNIRVYAATVNMNGGTIYGGDDLSRNNTDNVWLVRGTMNMSGNATVIGNTFRASGIRAISYDGYPSVLTLADTASVIGENSGVLAIPTNTDGDVAKLYITEGWAGTAYVDSDNEYTYGDTMDDTIVAVGSFGEDGAFTKGGTYTGTLLHKGIGVFGEEGNAVIATAGIVAEDGAKSWYKTNSEALAAYEYSENGYAILTGATAEIPETVAKLNVDIAGAEVTFSGNAAIYGSDSANDAYQANGKLLVAEGSQITVEPVVMRDAKRYIALEEEGAWSFHRLTMYMNAVTLRTEGNPGIYYKAVFQCDETLRDLVESYGVALSLQDVPGTDFETADKYTAYTGEDFANAYNSNKVNTVSGAVVGIMKERNTKEANTANANREIYANPYLKLNIGDGLLIMADGDNQGKTSDAEGFSGTAYSLFEVLQGVNQKWSSYSEAEQTTITSFLVKWAAYITDEAALQLQTGLDQIFPAA